MRCPMTLALLFPLALVACTDKGVDADGDGYSVGDGDCDDDDPMINPDGVEVCDGADNDCDGGVDNDAPDARTFYGDADGDGYGAPDQTVLACELPDGAAETGDDCDDSDGGVNPGADERCNGQDDDCDGATDEDDAVDATSWYLDADEDGHGDPETVVVGCAQPEGHVAVGDDCEDGDETVNPAADELCNGYDDDCDGTTDEDDATDAATWYGDGDGDGYGDATATTVACIPPSGFVADGSDCDDADALTWPGAEEFCDDADNDCDGTIDDGRRVPTDFATIQDAVDASTSGDLICVEAGIHDGPVDFAGKDLIVVGTWGSANTTIDGNGYGPLVQFDSAETTAAELSGFTLTNGGSQRGSGVYVEYASPTLTDLVITENYFSGNVSTCYGGGLYMIGSNSVLVGVEISSNYLSCTTAYGSGAYIAESTVSLDGVSVISNEGSGSYCYGALNIRNSSVADLVNVEVIDNRCGSSTSTDTSGALYFFNSTTATLDNVIVAGNYGAGRNVFGGGITVNNRSTVTVSNSVMHGNEMAPTASTSGARGSGITLVSSSTVTMVNSVVSDNETTGVLSSTGGVGVSSSTFSASYSDVVGNVPVNFYGTGDPTGSNGNLSVDPGFTDVSSADPLAWDFTLASSSALIDAGDPSILDTDGTTSDIGAYGGPNGAW